MKALSIRNCWQNIIWTNSNHGRVNHNPHAHSQMLWGNNHPTPPWPVRPCHLDVQYLVLEPSLISQGTNLKSQHKILTAACETILGKNALLGLQRICFVTRWGNRIHRNLLQLKLTSKLCWLAWEMHAWTESRFVVTMLASLAMSGPRDDTLGEDSIFSWKMPPKGTSASSPLSIF